MTSSSIWRTYRTSVKYQNNKYLLQKYMRCNISSIKYLPLDPIESNFRYRISLLGFHIELARTQFTLAPRHRKKSFKFPKIFYYVFYTLENDVTISHWVLKSSSTMHLVLQIISSTHCVIQRYKTYNRFTRHDNDFVTCSKRNDVKFDFCFTPRSGSIPRNARGYNNLLCTVDVAKLWSPIFTGNEQARDQKIFPAVRLKSHHDGALDRAGSTGTSGPRTWTAGNVLLPLTSWGSAPCFTNNDDPHFQLSFYPVSVSPPVKINTSSGRELWRNTVSNRSLLPKNFCPAHFGSNTCRH